MFLQRFFKTGFVHGPAFFTGNEAGEVDRESVGIVEFEGLLAVDGVVSNIEAVDALEAAFERAQEGFFFFQNHFHHKLDLRMELGKHIVEFFGQDGRHAVEHRFLEVEEGIVVAHSAAQDAADDVAGARVGGQFAVGNGKTHGAQVIGHDPHGHVGHFPVGVDAGVAAGVGDAGVFGQEVKKRFPEVGIVVGSSALHGAAEAFETHAGVDAFGGQHVERAVGPAVELHEHVVPHLDHVGVVGVDQFAAVAAGALVVGAQVDVDFGAGAAGTLVAHFPEVVFFAEGQDAVFRHVFFPLVVGFLVVGQFFFFVAAEHRHVEPVFGDFVHLGEQFPGPGDGVFFEIVAERPVAQHFEHGVVVAVAAHVFEVVMLAGHTQALLGIGYAGGRGLLVAEEKVLERGHAGVDEHERGVALGHDGGRGDDFVFLGGEKIEELAADVAGSHVSEVEK